MNRIQGRTEDSKRGESLRKVVTTARSEGRSLRRDGEELRKIYPLRFVFMSLFYFVIQTIMLYDKFYLALLIVAPAFRERKNQPNRWRGW